MRNKKLKVLYYGSWFTIALSACILLLIGFRTLVPFNWFVDIKELQFHDMCVGEREQRVTTDRYVRWTMFASSNEQMIYLENKIRDETFIFRNVDFTYEDSFERATFQIRWDDSPTLPGRYGVQARITIYPFFFLPIETFISAEEQQFNVVKCEV